MRIWINSIFEVQNKIGISWKLNYFHGILHKLQAHFKTKPKIENNESEYFVLEFSGDRNVYFVKYSNN